jgi:hypothetical protein
VSAAAERARAIRDRDRPQREVRAEVEVLPVAVESSKPRLVRQTVDLTMERHNDLAAWRTEARQQLGLVRLTNQGVLRELVGLLLADETVARRLRGRLIDVANEGRRD